MSEIDRLEAILEKFWADSTKARIAQTKLLDRVRALEAERDKLREHLAADGLREFGETQP